jgi:hypothetical protein
MKEGNLHLRLENSVLIWFSQIKLLFSQIKLTSMQLRGLEEGKSPSPEQFIGDIGGYHSEN